jgi:hypothetical protein
MAELWARIKASRDYIALFTVLGAALSLALRGRGISWQTISTVVPALAVVYIFLAWLRPRVFPAWRLLELSLYKGWRLPVTRSVLPTLWCFAKAWSRRGYGVRTFHVARLRVEAQILTGGLDGHGDDAASERGWGEHLSAMLNERRLMAPARPGSAPRFPTAFR